MIASFAEKGWEDYLYWQKIDKRVSQRINLLIKEVKRHPFTGMGDPEPLKHNWSGYWSRRVNREHRLVYRYTDETIIVVQCLYHY